MSLLALSLEDLREIVLNMAQLRIDSLRRSLAAKLRFRSTQIAARNAIYETQEWREMTTEQKTDLREVEQAIGETEKWHEPFEQQKRLILTERDAAVEAIAASAQGVRDWAAMHNRLIEAVEQGSGIDVTELQITVEEIRSLVERMRASRAAITTE